MRFTVTDDDEILDERGRKLPIFPNRNGDGEVISWKVRWREEDPQTGRRRHPSTSKKTAAAAVAFYEDVRYLRRQGATPARPEPSGSMTMDELGAEWLERFAFPNCTPRYARESARWWDTEISARIGQYTLEQLMQRPGVFGELQEQLTQAGMRAPSQRKVIGLVNAVLERGQRWHPEVLKYHPARGQFEPPSTKRKRLVRPLPVIALERIREAVLRRPVRDPLSRLFDAAFVSCMGEGIACRPSELRLSATWDGIGARTLLLQTVVEPDERDDAEGLKTGARSTLLLPTAREDVRTFGAALDARFGPQPGHGLIFQARGPSGPLWDGEEPVPTSWTAYNNWVKRVWRPACQVAARSERSLSWVAKARLYDARHSAVSLAIRAGYDQGQVARYAGHTIQTLAEIYQHVFDEYEGSDPIEMAELAADARRRVIESPNSASRPGTSATQRRAMRRYRARRKAREDDDSGRH
jgi:hypothetical protein